VLDVSEFHAGHNDRDVRFAQFMSGEKKVRLVPSVKPQYQWMDMH
jgi:hypothetical protein